MKVLIVEDDEDQAEDLEKTLRSAFKGIKITRIELEREFLERFDEVAEGRYDLAILDMMLEWSDPAPNLPPPPGTFDEAGLRCHQKLKSDARTAHVPVLVLSVLRKNLPDGMDYVIKTHDLSNIIPKVSEIIDRRKQ